MTANVTPSSLALQLSNVKAEHRTQLLEALIAAHVVAPKARSADESLFFAVITLRDTPSSAPDELKRLLAVIQSIPELAIFRGSRQRGPCGAWTVDMYFLIRWLLTRAQLAEPDTAISDLERYLSTESLELVENLAFDGVNVPAIASVREFEIVPWQTLPTTETKWRIGRESLFGRLSPTAAIRRRWQVPRLGLQSWYEGAEPAAYSFDPMQDVLRCVTATIGAAIRLTHWWFEPPEWAPWAVTQSRFDGGDMNLAPAATLTNEVLPQLCACADGFAALDEPKRQHLRVTLDRLNRSLLSWPRSVDAAIDLGIALESLYAPRKMSEATAYAVRTRAAKFLGGTADERHATLEQIRDVYDLRSCAVHAGRFDGDGAKKKWRDAMVVEAAIRRGQELAGRSLVKAIVEGEPDWEAFDLL